jgi:transposase
MAAQRTMELSAEQRAELERVRDRHPKAYMREKAAALLKIADGLSAHAVAQRGLLKARDPDSVYRWLGRYQAEGVAGLQVKPGRGRKAAFSP